MSEALHKILHIDDDESNRYAVKRILERAGFDVYDAENGISGLEVLTKENFDLVVLDIRLPDIDGFEVCRRIKADPRISSIPVLQTSASFVSSEHKVEGLESGADGYLAQPIEAAVLVATVRSLLRIRKAEKAALKAQHSRDALLAIVSHDLRNPLSSIMLLTKLMQKQIISENLTTEKILEKIVKIQTSGLRMNRLIQDLLDVSSMDEGKFKIDPAMVEIDDIIHATVQAFEEKCAEALIKIEVECHHKGLRFKGDRERILQVMENLVSNAIKFTPPHGKITISCQEVRNEIAIGVNDTGPGISAEDQKNIFDRYWQSEDNRKQGFGLGLSIVKGILDAHEGKVWVESKPGAGAKFLFSLKKA